MPARTTRQAARERLRAILEAELDRMIPPDERTPLKGRLFAEFEDQVDELVSAVGCGALEERAALDERAAAEEGGACPFCGSASIYLEQQETRPTLHTPHGPLRVALQQARCRGCDGSFSPSGAKLGSAQRGAALAPCVSARGSRGDRARF
jgi:hypothetical protein